MAAQIELYLLATLAWLLINARELTSSAIITQPSSYRLLGSHSSYAQYAPWHPCLNGTLVFEFKTHEPNGMLVYAQSLPYKYLHVSVADGNLRMRMRISEKDDPRGIFLAHQTTRVNDEKWHEVKLTRQNERTTLTLDGIELSHIHKEATLDGGDLHFGGGAHSSGVPNADLLVIGGIPSSIETYDLSLGTALFDSRFNGFIRNVKALNCSRPYLTRLDVKASSDLRLVENFFNVLKYYHGFLMHN